MSRRIYIGKVEALTGTSKPNAVGPAWYNLLPSSVVVSQIVDSVAPAQFAIGVLDTTTPQHQTLIAIPNRVRYIPQSLFSTEYANLSPQAQTSIEEVESFLGFNLREHTVELIVWAIVGHSVAKGISELADLV